MDKTEFGKAICEAVGENPEDVISIDIHVSLLNKVTATVKKIILDENGYENFSSVVKLVNWKEDKE